MEAVVGLLLVSLGVSCGVETYCDGRQDGSQCYGALGGTVVLWLMDTTSEIPKFYWKKETFTIFKWNNNAKTLNNTTERPLFIPSNGTFRIDNLNINDSGEYKLELYNKDGQKTGQRTLHLTVQAPVSFVHLVSECLSQGEKNVSCSSEGGDSPQYSWTLNGHTLTDTELLSGNNETNIITLRQNVSGRLVCSVRNQVSSVSKEEDISTCGFIFINCVINGTHKPVWVHKDNKSLCSEPTTVPTTVPHTTVGKETESLKTATYNTSSTHLSSHDNTFITLLPVIGGVFAALVILLVVGVAIICSQKKKNNSKVHINQHDAFSAEEGDDQELTYAEVRIRPKERRQVERREDLEVEYDQVKFSKRPQQTESASERPRQTESDDCVYAKVRKGR